MFLTADDVTTLADDHEIWLSRRADGDVVGAFLLILTGMR
jgi:hypothetical protein